MPCVTLCVLLLTGLSAGALALACCWDSSLASAISVVLLRVPGGRPRPRLAIAGLLVSAPCWEERAAFWSLLKNKLKSFSCFLHVVWKRKWEHVVNNI